MTYDTSLSSRLEVQDSWEFTNALDASTPKDSAKLKRTLRLANGTGENQVNENWCDIRTLAVGSSVDDIDLSGTLVNAFGRMAQFTAIKKLVIFNDGVLIDGVATPVVGQDMIVGAGPSGAFASLFDDLATSKLKIRSGGMLVLTAPLDGYAVTAGSADILRLAFYAGISNSLQYTIHLEGLGVQN